MASTAVVFGATGSIGTEIVRLFLHIGWRVVAFGRSLSPEQFQVKVSATGRKISTTALSYKRVSKFDHDDICGLIESCEVPQQDSRVYVNASGICFYAPFSSASRKDFSKMVKSNLETSFHILKHVYQVAYNNPTVPLLYIEIGSRAGEKDDHPNFSLYAMVKQGQLGLLRSLAAEMKRTQCAFLVLSPVGVKTRLYDRCLGHKHALREKFKQSVRLLSANYVAEVVIEEVEQWLSGGVRVIECNFKHRAI